MNILHNFLTADQIKYSVYEETRELFVKSLELLYTGESDFCKEKFHEYIYENVVNRTEDTDNSLKKFFRSVLTKFNEDHSAVLASSNMAGILDELA